MTRSGNDKMVQMVEQNGEVVGPTPVTRIRLNTVRECRRELAKLYLETRQGQLETSTATRLAYILTSLVNMIRDSELEQRIAALEAAKTHELQ